MLRELRVRTTLLLTTMASEAVVKTLFKSLVPSGSKRNAGYEYTFCIDKPSNAQVKIQEFAGAPVVNISKGRHWISLSVHEYDSLVENAGQFREKIEECELTIDPSVSEEMNYSVITSSSKRKVKDSIVKRRKKKKQQQKVSEEQKSTLEISDVGDEDE